MYSVEVKQVRTQCRLCQNQCGIVATIEDGNVIRIDGDPENPYNQGKACAKGRAGFYALYSPNRVTNPLRRTNPEKGPGIDPGWEPLSWDEALDLVVEKLKEIREDDPSKLWFATFDATSKSGMDLAWTLGYGTVPQAYAAQFFCGNAVHPMHFLNQFSKEAVPDIPLTRFILSEGGQYGSVVHYDTMNGAYELGRNREKIKVVSVDPYCSHAASMADEWIPIRPGTDAAFLIGLANVLINELGIYDAAFLKDRTNAPYLIGADGQYFRDSNTRKPLIWDEADGVAKPFDAPIGDAALFGTYTVLDQEVRPAFQVLASHIQKSSPEEVAQITDISALTIRRIAKEFGEAASIGATITIDGEQLPYRPVAVSWYRGLSSHKHAMLNGFAAMLLQTIVGGLDVPGGLMGFSRKEFRATEDGLLAIKQRVDRGSPTNSYPPRMVTPPTCHDLFNLFPVACYSMPFTLKGILEPDTYHTTEVQPNMLIQRRSNMMFNAGPTDIMTDMFRKIPFIVSFATEIEETTEFADVVFPSLHYLEQLDYGREIYYHTGSQPGVFFGQKPVVRPPFEPPWDQMVSDTEIMLELANRAGFLEDVYAACNMIWKLPPDYALELDKRYTYQEMVDRFLKAQHGPDKGLEWYMEDGLEVYDRSLQERYPGAYPKPRIHVYHEYMIEAGHQVEAVTSDLDIPWDTSDYVPMAEWRPCAAHTPKAPEYDLYLITAKVPYHALTFTGSNPLLQEVGNRLGYDEIRVHRDAAKRKGLKDGDWVEIETDSGKTAQGRVTLTAGIHPEVAVVLGSGGRWAKSATHGEEPTGIHFNSLLTMDDEHMDFVSAAVDSCLRVKISKLEEKK